MTDELLLRGGLFGIKLGLVVWGRLIFEGDVKQATKSFVRIDTEKGGTDTVAGAVTWLLNRVLNNSLDLVGFGTVDNNVDKTDFDVVEAFPELGFLPYVFSMLHWEIDLSKLLTFVSKRLFNTLSEYTWCAGFFSLSSWPPLILGINADKFDVRILVL